MALLIKYVVIVTKRAEVSFFDVADVLQDSISANNETLHTVILRELSVLGDDVSKLASVVKDHCFCHRLALACVKLCDQTAYIKKVSKYRKPLWKYTLRTLLRELQF